MSDKNLQYYLSHPDEMPTDTAEIERLTRESMDEAIEGNTQQITVDSIVGKADEPAPAAAKPEDDKPADVKAEETKPEEKPEILAKDGKNTIPYSQLESARQRAATAEALAQNQAKELEAKTAELEALRTGKSADASQNEAFLTEEELAAMEVDQPVTAKLRRAEQALLKKMGSRIEELEDVVKQQVAAAQDEKKTVVQTAIDANPTLAAWQTAEDKSMWDEAAAFDKTLRESPKYASLSLEERFAKVVELTQAANGVTPAREEPPSLTPEQIRAAAKAKLDQASRVRPKSLSDIPGGAPPAVDEKERLEQTSSVALGQQFMGMTREQLDAYLQQL